MVTLTIRNDGGTAKTQDDYAEFRALREQWHTLLTGRTAVLPVEGRYESVSSLPALLHTARKSAGVRTHHIVDIDITIDDCRFIVATSNGHEVHGVLCSPDDIGAIARTPLEKKPGPGPQPFHRWLFSHPHHVTLTRIVAQMADRTDWFCWDDPWWSDLLARLDIMTGTELEAFALAVSAGDKDTPPDVVAATALNVVAGVSTN